MNDVSLRRLQQEQAMWSERNFGSHPSWHPLLGVSEEVGELCHAHLKNVQNIRMEEDHIAKGQDAVGDIIVYLADYCTQMGFDLQACLNKAWNEVSQRDWTKKEWYALQTPDRFWVATDSTTGSGFYTANPELADKFTAAGAALEAGIRNSSKVAGLPTVSIVPHPHV